MGRWLKYFANTALITDTLNLVLIADLHRPQEIEPDRCDHVGPQSGRPVTPPAFHGNDRAKDGCDELIHEGQDVGRAARFQPKRLWAALELGQAFVATLAPKLLPPFR